MYCQRVESTDRTPVLITRAEEKKYRSLQQKKFRQEFGLFLVEGRKAISELIKSNFEIESILGIREEDLDGFQVCSMEQIARISTFKTPPDLIAVVKTMAASSNIDSIQSPVFILDAIRDPGNLGTIMRTVRWFGAADLILSEDCADIYNPKTIQSSMGALFHINVHKGPLIDIIPKLKDSGFEIFGTEVSGMPLSGFNESKKIALTIGNEGHGISDQVKSLCDGMLAIDGGNVAGVESLNAAMSVGIIAHHLYNNNGR